MTIHSGLLSELLNASTTSKRLMILSRFCFEAVLSLRLKIRTSRSKSSSWSKIFTASAPVNAVNLL
jgi:hypothetical protein